MCERFSVRAGNQSHQLLHLAPLNAFHLDAQFESIEISVRLDIFCSILFIVLPCLTCSYSWKCM